MSRSSTPDPDPYGLLAASERFYEAFRAGDLDALTACWSRRLDLACLHPGWEPLIGRGPVLESWRTIIESSGGVAVVATVLNIQVAGEVGIAQVVEQIGATRLAATNVFVLEEEAWLLLHHQAAPLAAAELVN